ncbi:MAG TPA: sodium:proton antiporter [Candidatus Binatia bacterium]|nr:sodium:proton antiporter [Candidatus Binatia bacterium]
MPEGTLTDLGTLLPVWSALPFAGILLSIAVMPLLMPTFWHHHFAKVSAAWALVFAVPFVVEFGGPAWHELAHVAIVDYVPFVILIATLFTLGGGIFVRGTLRGSPGVNAALMAVGIVLASVVGTTGASMVMIRPLLRANRARRHREHTVVFFIFLVSNIGGALTPLGDPPLFLGFLHGVPFFWTLALLPEMLFTATWVLALYLMIDLRLWRREDAQVRAASDAPRQPLGLDGAHNLLLLAVVVVTVIASGVWPGPEVMVLGVHQRVGNLVRDAVMLVLLAVSWSTTSTAVREANEYSWSPIREVAILFAGIFVTIIPALAMLRVGEAGAMAGLVRVVRDPVHFFWASGTLSSFLDNAPTYLAFLSTALGRLYPGVHESVAIPRLIAEHPSYLAAVSAGSVFMGANTYIGNAPNFMVKSIAEEAGVSMPSFFGYILRYSLPVLVTTFVVVGWLFFT